MTTPQPIPITQSIEDRVISMLQDENTGLVAMMTALAGSRDGYGDVPQLDLSDGGTQLYRAWMDQASYYATDDVEQVALFVFPIQSRDEHLAKSYDFSGHVQVGINVLLTEAASGVPVEIQKTANLFNDAMYSVFGILASRVLQADGIVFNGDMTAMRTKPTQAGSNWAQMLSFTLSFQIN